MNDRLHTYVIGVDFGTDSVRSVLASATDGTEIASSVYQYPRWRDQLFCNVRQSQYRQHPRDYIEGLESTIISCLQQAGKTITRQVVGISVDTTGSTPVAVDASGTPLGLLPGFENNPNAQFILWKDHTGIKEAEEINAHAKKFPVNYLQDVGGIYSSEWFWAKLLHILRVDKTVRQHITSWVEHCDWIPFLLTGGSDIKQLKRGVCSAGHKALWSPSFGGLPPNEFFASLDPLLNGFTDKLFKETYTADQSAGTLCKEWAERLGLSTDIVIGIGAFDAHMGAVGGQIEPYHLSKVMGTSTCDMLVAPLKDLEGNTVKGICGQVNGSIIPGMMGLEAGQSAFGDVYAWFKSILEWPLQELLSSTTILDAKQQEKIRDEISGSIISRLSDKASQIQPGADTVLAIDWLNGRRTPDANQSLKAALCNLDLGTSAPELFYSLAEATCFGAKAIVNRFIEEGVPVKGLIGLGGVAKKSSFIMQLMANTMNRPIRIHKSEQTCAIGAAMFAATAAGIYTKVEDAMKAMGQGFEKTYYPEKDKTEMLEKRYTGYISLGEFVQVHK